MYLPNYEDLTKFVILKITTKLSCAEIAGDPPYRNSISNRHYLIFARII